MNTDIAGTADKSIWGIMAGVFTAPTEAFVHFKKKPTIWIPLILAILIATVVAVGTAKYQGQIQYDLLKTSTVLPAEAIEEARIEAENPSLVSAALSAWIGPVIGTLVTALVAWILGSFVFGKKTEYKEVWGVTILSGLIPLFSALLKWPLIVAKGSPYVSLGLAALFPGKNFTSIGYFLLFVIDFFAIWGLIVEGIGFSTIFGISRTKGTTIAIIAWLVGLSMMLTPMLLGAMFAGIQLKFW